MTDLKNLNWIFKMAWRDSRRNRSRLFLFISSIILGVAALVAIQTFSDNLQQDIEKQAKTIIGADLVMDSNRPFSPEILQIMDSLGGQQSREISFASMVYFPKTQGTRLVQVRALEGDFPYYGKIETNPKAASEDFRNKRRSLVDQTLLLQFDSEPGDSVGVGTLKFLIAGSLHKVPGQTGITATVAPPVYIPMQYLDETGLIKKGSRIRYNRYFRFADGTDVDAMMEPLEERLDRDNIDFETVSSTKEDLGKSFRNLTKFLSFIAFAALLLGCIGVAGSVHIYIKEKLDTVAVLRCVGSSGSQAFRIYLCQILIMGLLGSLIGAAMGSILQLILPKVFSDFLPIEVSLSISWPAILSGILIGLVISLLFALIPLISIRKVSPLQVLRTNFEPQKSRDPALYVIYLLIVWFIFGFSYWLGIGSWIEAFYFTLGLMVAFAILSLSARGIMWLIRRYFPSHWSFIWRQSLANLYRPQNQTTLLVVSIGLGTALIATLYFVQQLLISQVAFSSRGDQPNMVLFDIQSQQTAEVAALTEDYDLPLIQQVPIVTMQLMEINGHSKLEAIEDTTLNHPTWAYNREYRVTYRDHLIDSETLVAGDWLGSADQSDSIYISIDRGYAENINVKLGDEILFNVQGAPVLTRVGSFREIEWNRVQTNFLVIFPTGVLEEAPQFHVIMTKVPSTGKSADFQRTMVKAYPNVSIIDLTLILQTVNDILDKVAFVIRFMALFSIFTGIIVLISSVVISKFQRIRESVLLRTLGARKKQVMAINALEYFFLGSLASAVGLLLSLTSTWALAYFVFETPFMPPLWPLLWVYLVITGITVMIGLMNSRGVLTKPPLEVLRTEV